MSQFAHMLRSRLHDARSNGRLGSKSSSIGGEQGKKALGAGSALIQRLVSQNPACAKDEDCKEVLGVLQIASTGTDADTRTALTRLQRLLKNLTAADSDVAADAGVQRFRRDLHVALDH